MRHGMNLACTQLSMHSESMGGCVHTQCTGQRVAGELAMHISVVPLCLAKTHESPA